MVDMEYVVGRYSQCWGVLGLDRNGHVIDCPNEVEMTRYLVFSERRKHPICEECKQRRKDEKANKIEKLQDAKIERILELLGEEDATINSE